jgi:hypothetical protein
LAAAGCAVTAGAAGITGEIGTLFFGAMGGAGVSLKAVEARKTEMPSANAPRRKSFMATPFVSHLPGMENQVEYNRQFSPRSECKPIPRMIPSGVRETVSVRQDVPVLRIYDP